MNVSQALDDIKTFLESDPLVQAAIDLVAPADTRQVFADVLRQLHLHVDSVRQAAYEQGRTDAENLAAGPQ